MKFKFLDIEMNAEEMRSNRTFMDGLLDAFRNVIDAINEVAENAENNDEQMDDDEEEDDEEDVEDEA